MLFVCVGFAYCLIRVLFVSIWSSFIRLVDASWDRDIVSLAIVEFAFYSRSACTE